MATSESSVGIYSIRAVSDATDIPISTLRYWESRYGLIVPQRTEGGHRLYSEDDLGRLRWLKARIDEGLQAGAAHRLLARELAESDVEAPERPQRNAVMILVAERDPLAAELDQHFLREEGFDVEVVLDGNRALVEARTRRPDLILVDLVLPGLNGIKVCEALREHPETRDIPILMFSVLDIGDAALRAGADGFLLKPLDRKELLCMVRVVLARSSTASGVTS